MKKMLSTALCLILVIMAILGACSLLGKSPADFLPGGETSATGSNSSGSGGSGGSSSGSNSSGSDSTGGNSSGSDSTGGNSSGSDSSGGDTEFDSSVGVYIFQQSFRKFGVTFTIGCSTWGDWVNSTYNTYGCYIGDDGKLCYPYSSTVWYVHELIDVSDGSSPVKDYIFADNPIVETSIIFFPS